MHRFVELHRDSRAVVFPQRDRCRYVVSRVGFPSLRVSAGARIPPLPHVPAGRKMSAREEVDGADWLRDPAGVKLSAQTLRQRDSFAMTLLMLDRLAGQDDWNEPESPFDPYIRRGAGMP